MPLDSRFTSDAKPIFLAQLAPTQVRVGYGELGVGGALGYEEKRVSIHAKAFPNALSAHAPSQLSFRLDGKATTFYSQVAINDDVHPVDCKADFIVIADGEVVGVAPAVRPLGLKRAITANISGATELSLVIRHHRWEHCHSVWCDPQIVKRPLATQIKDCFGNAVIQKPADAPRCQDCIATVGSPGFESWIDDLLGSIVANGKCPDAHFVILFFGESQVIERIARSYGATLVHVSSRQPLGEFSKSVLYSVAKIIPAKRFLCLDADTLVLGRLDQLLDSIDCYGQESVLICQDAHWAKNLGHAVESIYDGQPDDLEILLGRSAVDESNFPLVVNDGVFAASAAALNSIDDYLRAIAGANDWIQSGVPWRNQFVFNLALASLNSGRRLDSRFNVQLNYQDLLLTADCEAMIDGQPAHIVHFNGGGRNKRNDLRGRYRRITGEAT